MLVDANILLYSVDSKSPFHSAALQGDRSERRLQASVDHHRGSPC